MKMTFLSSLCPQTPSKKQASWLHLLPRSSGTLGASLVLLHPSTAVPTSTAAVGPARHCSLLKGTHLNVMLPGASMERGQVLFYRLAANFPISLSLHHVQGSRANFITPCTLWESLRRLFCSSPSLRWDQGFLGPSWLDLFLISSLTAASRVFQSFLLLQGSDGPSSTFLYLPEEHRGLSSSFFYSSVSNVEDFALSAFLFQARLSKCVFFYF